MTAPSIIYAGNREIGRDCLASLLDRGLSPSALLVPEAESASSREEMIDLVSGVPVLEGTEFREKEGIRQLADLRPDYIVSVHFPHIFPPGVLEIAEEGVLNLHPAFLPYNRGWHTPSWAILEGTPYGATLHWVDEEIDHGDLAMRRQLEVRPDETAHELYQRVLDLERELFEDAIPKLKDGSLPRQAPEQEGTEHKSADLETMRALDPDATARIGDLVDHLRALTTDRWSECAYIETDEGPVGIRVELKTLEADDE